MNIKLEITADSADQVLETLRALSATTVIQAAQYQGAVVNATEAAAKAEAEQPKSARGRKASNVVSLADAKVESNPSYRTPEQIGKDAIEAADKFVEAVEDPKADAKAADLAESLEEESTPPKPELSVDLVRKYAVKTVNELAKASGATDAAGMQSKAREAFNEMLKHFGKEKFTEIDAGKMGEVHDWLVAKRASASLPALDIATLV
jgi:hypothetical protein